MKRDRLIALGVFGLGLLFRLPWVLQSRTVRWDESDYLILGRNLLRGDGYQVFGTPDLVWPPGPPALAASAMALGVPLDYALPVWHLLAGALACVVLFYLARDVTGNELVASIAAVLAAVSPALVVWPLYWGSLSESAFLLCWLSGLWASWRVMRDGGKLAASLAGIAFGLAYLIRTEGLFWWALFLLIVIGAAIKKRQSWSVPLLFAAGFLLVALPYVAYLYGHTGRFMLTGKTGINLLISPYISKLGGVGQDYAAALDSTGQEILWLSAEPFDFSYIDFLLSDPVEVLRQIRRNLDLASQALSGPLLGLVFLALAGLGLFAQPWSRRRLAGEAFWLASLLPLGLFFISKVETRYLVPAIPVLLVWVAQGIVTLSQWAAETWRLLLHRKLPQGLVVALLLTGLILMGLREQMTVNSEQQAGLTPSHKQAGLWLAEHSEPGAAVMSRNPQITLYADRPLVAFPKANWQEVLAYARARNARYLVTDDWEITRLRPQLSPLLDPSQAPPELEYLTSFSDEQRTTLIYSLED